jgi:hypothetical protein
VRGAGCRETDLRIRRREKNVLDIPFYRSGVLTTLRLLFAKIRVGECYGCFNSYPAWRIRPGAFGLAHTRSGPQQGRVQRARFEPSKKEVAQQSELLAPPRHFERPPTTFGGAFRLPTSVAQLERQGGYTPPIQLWQ